MSDGGHLSLNALLRLAKIEWHGVALGQPDWSDQSHSLALTLRSLSARYLFHIMMNAYWESLTFELPQAPADGPEAWRRCIDTALPSPEDISLWRDAPVVPTGSYLVQPRSIVLLARSLGRPDAPGTQP